MANEGGGRIALGVSDKPPRRVVGTQAFELPARTCGGLHERLQIRCCATGGACRWPRAGVPGARPSAGPRALHVDGRYLMRAGDELVPMTPDQLRAIFAEGEDRLHRPVRFDGAGQGWRGGTAGRAGLVRPAPAPAAIHPCRDRRGAGRRRFVTRQPEGLAITNLGALVLAKAAERLRQRGAQGRARDRLRRRDQDAGQDSKDWVADSGYAVGFVKLVDQITPRHQPAGEIRAALRQTTMPTRKKALREILGNALVHQDLSERGTGVVVEVYDDRVEIVNPGLPLLPVDRFIGENQSRNERLADACASWAFATSADMAWTRW